ncbi:MAG TPA: hypothetical protein PLV06_02735 [Bacteroidales bacterium]|nr:hypothetical protein [Bacteroidales bacterium]HPJ58563.1 hypothetical protein [Bacteroidales bacterium]HPR11278.1 hypothetical protein [Bacteroidales bacterium]HRW86375.1 hypothetical protein [Bacteroidales bacterium]
MSEDQAIRDKVEEKGKVFEKFGLTPMQGRIVAYFTLADTPEKTFEEVVTFFNSSKSSVSNSLNYLLQYRIIDYRTYAARRKRYFYLTDGFVRIYMEKVLKDIQELKDNAISTVTLRTPGYPEVSERILKWVENANILEESLVRILSEINEESL